MDIFKDSAPLLGVPRSSGKPCPALPICEMVGNARNGCETGGSGHVAQTCLAGLILLTARGQGLYTEKMEDGLQKRKIGFLAKDED